jgi:hypothetical protein
MSGWRHKTRGAAITDWPSFHDQRRLAMAMPSGPQKSAAAVEEADRWYVKICTETTLSYDDGDEIRLKGGAPIRACETTLKLRHFARFRRLLLRDAWLFRYYRRSFSRFGYSFNNRWQCQPGLFRSAMVIMVQRLDARSFLFHTQVSLSIFLALVLKVFRNRFRCHSQSLAEPSRSKLSNFDHFVTN